MEDAGDEEAPMLPKGADASAAARASSAHGTALRQSTKAPRRTRQASVGQPHPAHLVGSTRNPYTADRSPSRDWQDALWHCFRSKQLWLNVVYFVYSVGLFVVDLNGDVWAPEQTNKWYRFFTVMHMVSAQMFIWSWTDAPFHMHLYPEYLNALAAGLFYWAATLYRDDYAFTIQRGVKQFGQFNNDYLKIRYLELAAAGVEAIAAVGWVSVWFKLFKDEFGPVGAAELCGDQRTYQRNIFDTLTEERQDAPASAAAVATTAAADAADAAGGGGCDTDTGTGATGAGSSTGLAPHKHYPIPTAKGWTLQDPDLWANATILLASVVYFVYQIEVLVFDDIMNPSVLYLYGDFFYCANAFFYILACMRDMGVFMSVAEYKFLFICTPVGEERHLQAMRVAHRRRRSDARPREGEMAELGSAEPSVSAGGGANTAEEERAPLLS